MAQQKGDWVYVYDENNQYMWCRQGELYGFTSGTLTVKVGNSLYMYDVKNNMTGSRFC